MSHSFARRIFKSTVIIYQVILTFLISVVPVKAEDLINKEVPRLRDAEVLFINAMVAIWALAIPYFLFNIIYIGFLYMTSLGDENKAATAKQRGGKLVLSAVILFGGWVVVFFLMQVLGLKSGECLEGTTVTKPFFRFFFANACP